MFDWNGKNVLVTGASGFLGSWLSENLVSKNANVTILVKENSPRIRGIEHLLRRVNIIKGDIKNEKTVENAMKNQDIVFHLAAITQVLYSIKNPRETMETNLNGTLNVLECMRRWNNETFLVYMSTDKVYGEPNKLPIGEDNLLLGKSPYDASKLSSDRTCYCYHQTYGLGISIARSSNIYGGREANELRAVPDFVRAVIKSKPPVIRGSGKHERDFMFVSDLVNGLLSIAENQKKTNGETINFGTGKAISIYDLSQMIIDLAGQRIKLKPKVVGGITPGEINVQYMSYKRANQLLGWEPEVELERGLKLTIDWYKKNPWFEYVINSTSEYYGIKNLF
jgi:CDP-glucose 4,6-dehydratase